ncbi:hypothetical protein [Kitasatospora phosalacinea]|uniref:hypothetical protein n=1 Tax=Kitasatospora phosalacinea TaxID=2065 RepID=UPI000527D7C3|nr:hypothetical protein [Kitasatospora phosalacinea]
MTGPPPTATRPRPGRRTDTDPPAPYGVLRCAPAALKTGTDPRSLPTAAQPLDLRAPTRRPGNRPTPMPAAPSTGPVPSTPSTGPVPSTPSTGPVPSTSSTDPTRAPEEP